MLNRLYKKIIHFSTKNNANILSYATAGSIQSWLCKNLLISIATHQLNNYQTSISCLLGKESLPYKESYVNKNSIYKIQKLYS